MTGTHYTLDRDRDDNKNPMDRIKEKACRTCGTVKPNTFSFFGKKLWKTRVDLTTNEVCLACQKAKTSASMKAKWAARKQETAEYWAEQDRMARAANEAQERARAQSEADTISAQVKAVEPLPLDKDDDDGIRPISLEESTAYIGSVDSDESAVVPLDDVEPEIPVKRVETDSERLMRELLEKP
jgi:hypothetical protein